MLVSASKGAGPYLAVDICSELYPAPAILGTLQRVHSMQLLVDKQLDPVGKRITRIMWSQAN